MRAKTAVNLQRMEAAILITRSYNKHTGTCYAYDTSCERDEKVQEKGSAQKKVQAGTIRSLAKTYPPENGTAL